RTGPPPAAPVCASCCETASTCPSPPGECRGSSSGPASRRTAPCSPPSDPPPRTRSAAGGEGEPLAVPLAATAASHPPDLDPQEDARVAARQIATPPYTPVVPTQMNPPAAPAGRFFARRASVMRRAFGSPKIPRTVGWGRKPGNVYVSHRRRRRFDELAIATSCPIQSPYETQKTQYPWGFKPHFPLVSSTRFPDEPKHFCRRKEGVKNRSEPRAHEAAADRNRLEIEVIEEVSLDAF